MFTHNKRLQYTVRVGEPNPVLASLMLEQFGGPDGELGAAMRYFTQGLGEDDPGRKDLLLDIATEELSHLEIIGSIVAMLNKGVKAELSEAALKEAELYMAITGGGDSHTQALLYGGGPALTSSSARSQSTAAAGCSRGCRVAVTSCGCFISQLILFNHCISTLVLSAGSSRENLMYCAFLALFA